MYRFHRGVGVSDEILSAYEQNLLPWQNVQPANNVKVVETETKTRSFAGNLWSIANTWEKERELATK